MSKDKGILVQTADRSNENAISVSGVAKSFKLPHNKQNTLKGVLVNLIGKGDRTFETQQVLKDISFEIKRGEFFGIVGRNGSGKSTLLKMLAGIYTPTKGSITVNGSLTPFIELGVGFNPELTGRENVYLNGALFGFNNSEMDVMYDDIVSFAELEQFMDQKLKNYSSGMQVRLAFSIAIRAQSDILLLDEVLAVGDAAFQQKCYNYFDELKRRKQTVILVTHDMNAVRQFCDRAMIINDGAILKIGTPAEASSEYEDLNYTGKTPRIESDTETANDPASVIIKNEEGKKTTTFKHGSKMAIEVQWNKTIHPTIIGVALFKGAEVVFATNTIKLPLDLSHHRVELTMELGMGNGNYSVRVVLFGQGRYDALVTLENDSITIYGQPKRGLHGEEWEGITYLSPSWEAESK